MAEKRKRIIGLCVSAALFLLLGTLFFSTAHSVSRELPRAQEYNRSRLSKEITFATYEKIPEISFPDHLAVSAELTPSHDERAGDVKPVLVNEHFFEVYSLRVNGSGITQQHVADKTPAAVISDQTAHRISLDGDAVGQPITLLGKTFTVAGIYHKPSGFLRGISSDIYDRVYIPYTCCEGYETLSIDAFAAEKDTYSEKALPLLGMTKNDNAFYLENDLVTKRRMIAVLPNWLVSFIGLILAVVVIKLLKRFWPPFFAKLREDAQQAYFWGVMRRNWRGILLRILATAALIAVPVLLFLRFPVRLILPSDYIPAENLFDLSHYLDAFTRDMQAENAHLTVGNGYYAHLFSNAMLWLSVLLVILAVLAVTIAVQVKRIIKRNNDPK